MAMQNLLNEKYKINLRLRCLLMDVCKNILLKRANKQRTQGV